MLAYDPLKAQAKTGANVRGSQMTPVVASPVSSVVGKAGSASHPSVKVGSGNHISHMGTAKSSEHLPGLPTHSYGAGPINKIHPRN